MPGLSQRDLHSCWFGVVEHDLIENEAEIAVTLSNGLMGFTESGGRMSVRVTGYDFAAGGASRNGVTFVSPSPI
jgi:hypothetical protein